MLLRSLLSNSSTTQVLYSSKREVIKLKFHNPYVFHHVCLCSTKNPYETAEKTKSTIKKQNEVLDEADNINLDTSTGIPDNNDDICSKTLAINRNYTDKFIFGPLLETSSQKKKRLKQKKQIEKESKEKDNTDTTKNEKKLRLNTEALIYKEENIHLMNVVDVQPHNKFHEVPKTVKFKMGPNVVNNSRKQKIRFLKKLHEYPKSVNLRTKKLIVTAWTNDKKYENDVSVVTNDSDTIDDDDDHNFNSVSKIDTRSPKTWDSKSPLQRIKEYQYTRNNENKTSYISVDNSKFSAVPNVLDIYMIQNFPLFNVDAPVINKCIAEEDKNISTIGIFDGGYRKLPSVRKILDATMPSDNRIALERWKLKMIKELGEDGFEKYRRGLLDRGELLHGCIQSELHGVSPSVDDMPTIKGFWTSLKRVFPDVSDVKILESRIIHPHLYYQGAVDCVGLYKGTPMLIEWKTSSKPKLSVKSMFDDPIQMIAYLGALNFDETYTLPFKTEKAMLVVAYDSGLPANIHILNKEQCQHYWRIWCTRLTMFWKSLKKEDKFWTFWKEKKP